MRFATIALLITVFTGTTYAQDQSISGPILGFTVDRNATAIAPIFGVLGASLVGEPLDLGININDAVISPDQNYALAVRSDNGTVVVLKLLQDPRAFMELPASATGASRIAISPRGTAALFFNGASFQAFRGLPDFPQMAYEFDTSILPGEPSTIAVSDDGNIILATFIDDTGQDATWVITSNGSLWQAPVQHVSSFAFLPHRYDALVADAAAQEVSLLLDLDKAGNRVPLVSLNGSSGSSLNVAASQDGSFFVVTSENPGVAIVDAASLTSPVIDCSCLPGSLHRLNGNRLFLLNGLPSDLLHVLEVSSEPRVVVLPAKRNRPEPVTENSQNE